MKYLKRSIVFVLAIAMCIALLPMSAQAASKKTVYVIKTITVKEGKTQTSFSPKYTGKGLISRISAVYADEKLKETFTYSGSRIKTLSSKVLSGDHKGSDTTVSYKWSGGKLTERIEDYGDGKSTTTYTYDAKNRIKSSNNGHETTTYTYKSGHVKKAVGENITYSAAFDSKGNITKWTRKFNDQKIGYYNASLKYGKSGRVTKLTATYKSNPMQNKKKTRTVSFTYKKVSVPASYADTIADQQWQLINNYVCPGADSFTW